MNSQRLTAQLGLLAAAAVLVTSLGILASNGGDNSQPAVSTPTLGANSHQTPSTPMPLSASADIGTTAVVQR